MVNQRNVDSRLVNWTKEERLLLLDGLKEFGSRNFLLFTEIISGKSEEEIKAAIKFYEKRLGLSSSLEPKTVQKRKRNKQAYIPLASWANFLINSYKFEDLRTSVATALELIGHCEIKPPSVCTEKIDFRKIYLMLAEATEGKTIPYDKHIMSVLNKCITETALTSKAFIRCSKYKNVIKSINVTERDTKSFIKPTANMELAILRHLVSQKSYNPFHFTEDYLIPSAHQ